jgi:hypothetical protein
MNCHKVRFWKRIINPEKLRKVVHSSRSTFQGIASLLFEAPGCVYTDRNIDSVVLSLRVSLDVFKIADCPC